MQINAHFLSFFFSALLFASFFFSVRNNRALAAKNTIRTFRSVHCAKNRILAFFSISALFVGSRCRRITASLPSLRERALFPRPVRHIGVMLHKAAKDAAPPGTRPMCIMKKILWMAVAYGTFVVADNNSTMNMDLIV